MRDTPTFITEAFRLVTNVQWLKHFLLRNKWLKQHYLSILNDILCY